MFDVVRGSGSLNPFTPPLQMTAHAASVVSLLLVAQRRRRERQTAAEVGVWQGQLSRWLLTCCPFLTLHMIDPWAAPPSDSSWFKDGDRFAKRPQEQHDAHYALVQELADQFNAAAPASAPRAFLNRKPSLDAAADYVDGSLDVVFIDGAHDYKNVKADIAAWRPKVRPGGFLSGHDYKTHGNYFGLIRAVNEATAELGLTIQVFPGKVWACRIPA